MSAEPEAPAAQPPMTIEDVDPTLKWLLRRMTDEWGAAGVKAAVDLIEEENLR